MIPKRSGIEVRDCADGSTGSRSTRTHCRDIGVATRGDPKVDANAPFNALFAKRPPPSAFAALAHAKERLFLVRLLHGGFVSGLGQRTQAK